MMHKEVLLVGRSPKILGGISTSVANFLNSSLNNNYKINYFETGKGEKIQTTGSSHALYRMIYQLSKFIITLSKNTSIVHIHTSSFGGFWRFSLYVLICKLRNKPVILHVHGGAFKLFYTNSNSIQKVLIRETLELSTALIVLSSYWKSFFQSIVPDCKIRVIPNSVTVQEINEFDPEKETVNILFLGALSKNKGLNELITIIPKIINYNKKVVITIAGFPIQKEKKLNFLLKALKQNSKFSENFCFIENLIGKEKDKVFKNTDIYVLPSYFEGLPFTILESMSYGIPVITTDVGSIPDVVEPLKNGLFIKSKSEKDLLEKLIFLIDNFSLRVEIGKNNHEKIKKYYSHESIFEKVDSIYKSVIIS